VLEEGRLPTSLSLVPLFSLGESFGGMFWRGNILYYFLDNTVA